MNLDRATVAMHQPEGAAPHPDARGDGSGTAGGVEASIEISAEPNVDPGVEASAVDRIEEGLADVERALARLDEGTYGRCEVCGDVLSDLELEHAPATRFCRAHLPMSLP